MKNLAKAVLCLAIVLPYMAFCQGGTWVWMSGTSAFGSPDFGTLGVASASNTPGVVSGAATWVDQQNKFWLLTTGDMWQYDPLTKLWTFQNGPGASGVYDGVYGTLGVPSSSNHPGTRTDAACFNDGNGYLWLFGGHGYDASGRWGFLSDLWKYNTTTNQWTWIGGSSSVNVQPAYGTYQTAAAGNTPGGRAACASWFDGAGNLWIFAGYGVDSVQYNDMWRCNLSTQQWAWMKGPSGTGGIGDYGLMGVENVNNVPPVRSCLANYKDANGNLYLFGGYNYNNDDDFDDIWKYNLATNNWTWVAGHSTMGYYGNTGTYCTDNGYTGPMSRWDDRSPQLPDCSRAFLVFGGENETVENGMNDLWSFNPQTGQWRWACGVYNGIESYNYGNIGVASASNYIPNRQSHAMWVDYTGNLWVFSGYTNTVRPYQDDMWQFIPNSTCFQTPISSGVNYTLPNNPICIGDSSLLTLSNISQVAISPTSSATVEDSVHIWLHPSVTTTYTISGNTQCRNNDTAYITLVITQPGELNYSISDTNICQGTSASLTAINQSNVVITPTTGVTWLDSSVATLSPAVTTTYKLKGVSTLCGGQDSTQFTIHVTPHLPITVSVPDTDLCPGATSIGTFTGISNLTVTSLYYYNLCHLIDSFHVAFVPSYSGEYVVTGNTSCGGPFVDSIHFTIQSQGIFNYSLSRQSLCSGDSSLLTLTGASNVTISPSTRLRWVDSAHVLLYPTSNTTYKILGYNSCGQPDSAGFTIRIIQPGSVDDSISSSFLCNGGTAYLYVYGLKHVSISPYSYFYYTDSADGYSTLTPYASTTYTITGQSVCGGYDTAHVSVSIGPNPSFNISKTFLCRGDSALFSSSGITHLTITPVTGVSWSDSAHAVLFPDTTTTYTITGSTCSGPLNYTFTVAVGAAGEAAYTLSDPGSACYGSYETLNVYGISNPVISPYSYGYLIDTTHYYYQFYVYFSTVYTITGRGNCGGYDTLRVPINVTSSVPASHTINRTSVCPGGAAFLTLYGMSNIGITPPAGISWVDSSYDSSHVYLHPDSTTTYNVTGYTCTGYLTSFTVTIRVINPSVLNDSIEPPPCNGGYSYIYLYGVREGTLQVNPYRYVYWLDSSDAEIESYVTVSSTDTIIAQSVCGPADTAIINLPVSTQSSLWPNQSICKGSSTVISLAGVSNAYISPVTGVYWLDTADIRLNPDTTTNYTIYYTNCQGYSYSRTFTVTVVQPGMVNYTVDTGVCSGEYTFLEINGLYNPVLTPYISLNMSDSTEYYGYLYPTATTTYTITGHSVCPGYDTAQFTVNVYPPAYISITNTTLCQGDSASISFSGLTNVTISPNTGVNWLSSNSASIVPDTSGYYYVSGYSMCSASYYSQSYYLNVSPANNLSYTLYDSMVCSGQSDYLLVNSTTLPIISPFSNFNYTGGNSYYTYLYPTSNTTYTLIGSPVCGGSDTVVFNVYVNSAGSYNLSSSTICPGDSTKLIFTGVNYEYFTPDTGITIYDYDSVWLHPTTTTTYTISGETTCYTDFTEQVTVSVGPINASVSGNDSIICSDDSAQFCAVSGYASYLWSTGQTTNCINTNQAGTYTVTISDGNGCSAVSRQKSLFVHISPTVNIIATDSVICSDKSSQICASSGYSYLWNTGQTVQCIQTNLSGTYYVTITDDNGCTAQSTPVSLQVEQSPSIALSGTDSVICSNDSVQFCTNPGYATYSWSTGQTGTCIITSSPGSYFVVVTDANGCSTQSNSVLLQVKPAPLVAITGTDSIICFGDSSMFCATPGYSLYQWNTGQSTNCIEATLAGNYYLTVTDQEGCTAESNHIGLDVHIALPVEISVSGDTFKVYNTTSQQWLLNGNPIPGATSNIYIATTHGNYSVQVTDTNGCTSTSNMVVLGLTDINQGKEVLVYPNPLIQGNWWIEVTGDFVGRPIEIFDENGRRVYKSEIKGLKSEIQINVAQGIYFLHIPSQNDVAVYKLIKL